MLRIFVDWPSFGLGFFLAIAACGTVWALVVSQFRNIPHDPPRPWKQPLPPPLGLSSEVEIAAAAFVDASISYRLMERDPDSSYVETSELFNAALEREDELAILIRRATDDMVGSIVGLAAASYIRALSNYKDSWRDPSISNREGREIAEILRKECQTLGSLVFSARGLSAPCEIGRS
jgi:hypothetical protein